MTSPIFLQDLPIEQLEKLSKNDIQKISNAEKLYWDNKPHIIYYVAVHGAKTQNDGLVNVSSTNTKNKGLSIARVGDEVIYADGTTSKIISGAGTACIVDGSPVALVGSRLENGDEIIESPNNTIAIRIYKDQALPQNFLSHD
ncbi:PAAR domain-containing protein [Acinetobacter pittii]|uniref:PAAR domain-containing protein n=1 Tax=Acinetobacter pittii TaxID=48296 RepID=UPI00202EEF7E|nr:PAAR domain-containing protein [Acinetobacter pittii]MCM1963022.1 PAAR domain-containing protein [Acinetobacter pittii]MCM1979298.1 PAAR domain-containing protein [Acinetobacter pittii]